MTKMTLNEASTMLRNKRGAGKAKRTNIKLEIEFDAGINKTPSILLILDQMLQAIQLNSGVTAPAKNFRIKEEVVTELEENADWQND